MATHQIFPTEILMVNIPLEHDEAMKVFNSLLFAPQLPGKPVVSDPLSIDTDETRKLTQLIRCELAKFLKTEMFDLSKNWATLYKPHETSSLPIHADDHYMTEYIAIFYLLPGESHKGGELKLYDPKWVNPYRLGQDKRVNTFSIKPELGLLTVFPSYLFHSVSEYSGADFRVSYNMAVKLLSNMDISPSDESPQEF